MLPLVPPFKSILAIVRIGSNRIRKQLHLGASKIFELQLEPYASGGNRNYEI
jgi:hypothetical protein